MGTWDVPINGDMTIIDAILGSVTTVALTNVPVTLTATQAQVAVLRFTGTLTGNVAITLPQQAFYLVQNQCSGAFVVTLKSASPGNIIAIPRGNAYQVFNDGTDLSFVNLGETGQTKFWYASALPTWVTSCTVQPYLACDGATFNATTYAALNALLGGNTLPDLRSYTQIPLDTFGTAAGAAGRIGTVNTGNGTIVGATLGTSGGRSTNTLLLANLPVANLSSASLSVALANATNVLRYTGSFGDTGSVGPKVAFNAAPDKDTLTASVSGTVPLGGSATPVNGFQISKMAGIVVIKT